MNHAFLSFLVAYLILAAILYIRYETTSHLSYLKKPPRHVFRFAMPWYYHLGNPRGTWFFSFWNHKRRQAYPEVGIRILGFEYWVEYWK